MAGSGASGSYIRVEVGRATPMAVEVDAAEPLIVIDVAGDRAGGWEGEVADQLRFVDEAMLARHPVAVVRAPAPADSVGLGLIGDLIEQRAGIRPLIAEADFPIGAPPTITWSDSGSHPQDGAVLAQARSVEVAALLKRGKAHWQPQTYHFQLPSREHRSDFIRVGDALRSPRDARVLASWLHWSVVPGRAVLLDSSTLMPLAMALEDAASQSGVALGPIAVRDGYPDSLLSDEELIELTVGASGALIVVSVSSTGGTLTALGQAVTNKGVKDWWVEALVDRRRLSTVTLSPGHPESGVQAPWLCIPEQALDFHTEGCGLCKSRDRAPAVLIDPGSFANTALPEPPVVVMPDPPKPARDISRLLEMYSDVDGMGVDCDPAARTRVRRVDRRWGVRFYPHLLLRHESLVEAVASQLSGDLGELDDGRVDLPKLRGFDTMVVLDEDLTDGAGSLEQLLNWLHDTHGASTTPLRIVRVPSKPTEDHLAALERDLGEASHILIVTVGTVTGGTLHELLIRVNRALADREKGDFMVSGFVVHARPPSFREWRSVRSAYSQRLVAAWMTYLPASDHPLAEEQRLFRQTLDETSLSSEADAYARARRQWVLNNPTSEWPARRETWDASLGAPNPGAVLLGTAARRGDI